MVEQFANDAVSQLDGAVDDVQTNVTVQDDSAFPVAPFRIRIDNELLRVTDASSPTWTVERGIEDTTAAAHDDGVEVSHVVTAAAVTNMRAPLNAIEVFTADDTFNVPPGITRLWVEVVGAGGGGGGTEGPGGAGGGAGGGYAAGIVEPTPEEAITVTVGLGGTGGTGDNGGNAGGSSSFGSYMSATGGDGGLRSTLVGAVVSEGGAGSNGDINAGGTSGGVGSRAEPNFPHSGGFGGNSFYLGGVVGSFEPSTSEVGRTGFDGQPYGGGGSGACAGGASDSGDTPTGGTGADGVVIVRY